MANNEHKKITMKINSRVLSIVSMRDLINYAKTKNKAPEQRVEKIKNFCKTS